MHGAKKEIRFDQRARKYDEGFEGRLSKRFYKMLIDQVALRDEAHVLDVGCGTGELLRRLSERSAFHGYGIDSEQNMVAEAQKKCPDMNIQQALCDVLPFENGTFDTLTACMAYHHFSDQNGFAKEAARVVKSGGSLYISDVRLPIVLRQIINTILRHLGLLGVFHSPQQIYADFAPYGFRPDGFVRHGYAQVVKLTKA